MSRTTLLAGMMLSLTLTQVTFGQDVAIGTPGDAEPLYPYDAQEPWLHGYWQEMPFYGGFRSFRPYNYKQVLSQSQTAAGWGMSPTMPYSQQYWARYQEKASMSPFEVYTPATMPQPMPAPQTHPSTVPMAPMMPEQGVFPNGGVPNGAVPNGMSPHHAIPTPVVPMNPMAPGRPQAIPPQPIQTQSYQTPMPMPALRGPMR